MSTLPLFDRSPLFAVDPPKLRPYQSRAIDLLRKRVCEGKRRILLVAPTAAGKMTMLASIIRTSSVPVLFIAHRLELIDQCVDQLARLGITNVGVMRADDERTDSSCSTQIASIATLARRRKPPAGLVLIDEAHRAAADSYLDIIFEHYKEAIILGFTATPTRYDGRPLGNLFEVLDVVCTYAELIKGGFIVEPICFASPQKIDLSGVRISGGDYDEEQLGEVMRNTSLVGNLLEHWQRLAHMYPKPDGTPGMVEGPRRRTFIFASGIKHSLDICERFSKAGVKIAHLDGTTPERERRRIIKALGDGDLEAITNVGVLLEGVDVPSAKCVAHARPTRSLVLYRQSVGRILRPWHPGCPPGCLEHPSLAPLLLDHAENMDEHGAPHEDLHWELTTKSRRFDSAPPPMRICKSCYAYMPAHRILCPYCGADQPPPESPTSPKETQDQLQRRDTTPEALRRMYFDQQVKKTRLKGYLPGYASRQYQKHYGVWPPWEWSEEIKASFASDPNWQAAYEANQTRREKRDAESKAKAEAAGQEVEAPPETTTDSIENEDAPFSDWLEGQGIG